MTGRRSTVPRSAVELDPATRLLRMGSAERRVDDPSDADTVYGAYLSLLYAVRGARRGEELPLRSADLDALLGIVGDDPETIERRLVQLMGCTPEEASLLRRVLLRHRALTATVGVAAGLSLLALLGPSAAGATPAPAVSATVPAVPATVPAMSSTVPADAPQPPLMAYLTTDEGEHVPVPAGWDDTSAAAESVAEVAPEAVSARPANPPAAAAPSAARDRLPVVPQAAPTQPESVLAEPRAPIDRPGSWTTEPTGRESEVVLGEPRAPIDRPGSWTTEPTGRESEVVLGEPTAPIDRPEPGPTAAAEPTPAK